MLTAAPSTTVIAVSVAIASPRPPFVARHIFLVTTLDSRTSRGQVCRVQMAIARALSVPERGAARASTGAVRAAPRAATDVRAELAKLVRATCICGQDALRAGRVQVTPFEVGCDRLPGWPQPAILGLLGAHTISCVLWQLWFDAWQLARAVWVSQLYEQCCSSDACSNSNCKDACRISFSISREIVYVRRYGYRKRSEDIPVFVIYVCHHVECKSPRVPSCYGQPFTSL